MRETLQEYLARKQRIFNEKGYYIPKNRENSNLGRIVGFNRKLNLDPYPHQPTIRKTKLAKELFNNFKKNGIISANRNYNNSMRNNIINVHRAYYGRFNADPRVFTPHGGRTVKNKFLAVFGFVKGGRLYNAAIMAHYPSKLNSSKFGGPGANYYNRRREYRTGERVREAFKKLKLKSTVAPLWIPNSPVWRPISPVRPNHPNLHVSSLSRTPSPRRPNREVNAATKLRPILEQYGRVSSHKPKNIVNLAKRMRAGELNWNSVWNKVYNNGHGAFVKFRKLGRK